MRHIAKNCPENPENRGHRGNGVVNRESTYKGESNYKMEEEGEGMEPEY